MGRAIQEIIQMPVFSGIAAFAVLLVVGLYLSGWNERRRNRKLLKQRARLRALNRGALPTTAAPEHSPWRVRWVFVTLALIAGVTAALLRQTEARARGITLTPERRPFIIRPDDLPPGFVPISQHPIEIGLAAGARMASENEGFGRELLSEAQRDRPIALEASEGALQMDSVAGRHAVRSGTTLTELFPPSRAPLAPPPNLPAGK